MPTTEERLERLEDERDIRALAARFADTATRNDLSGFEALWTPDAEWILRNPYAAHCHGIGEIMDLIRNLQQGKEFFVQFVHSGVIELNGDRASARWIIHEVAKGPGEIYYTTDGLFNDQLVRVDGSWRFTRREWTCLYLDTTPFPGTGYVTPERVTASGHGESGS